LERRIFLKAGSVALMSLAGAFAGGIWGFLRQAKFGGEATGERLGRIQRSPNFRNGRFENLLETPMMTGENGSLGVTLNFIFNGNKRRFPTDRIPSVRRDLRQLNPAENHFVWFGHSSYFLQVEGKRILVDPVLSGHASPVSFTTKAFAGTDPYTVADLPDIDYLFITHDHWDHLDHETVTKLRPKVKRVICGLGVGAHLERWGYAPAAISEGDWGDRIRLGDGFTTEVLPARHFSGRGLHRNQTLWASFAVRTAGGYKIFLGGDGGYGPHFKEFGERFGGFDLAVLENGQYDAAWRYIHLMPEETLRAGEDLQAKLIVPVHNSKFCISNHDWDAPLRSLTDLAGAMRPELVTPMIGSVVRLDNPAADCLAWWTTVA
jgi:L-ascorbate metabolism protein UlaG (beta-lactamase superfamily)